MQGLPFDESDFPSATTTSTWEQSPRIPIPQPQHPQQLDDELYRFVAPPPPPSHQQHQQTPQQPEPTTQDDLVPYSTHASRRDLYRIPNPVNRIPTRQHPRQPHTSLTPIRIVQPTQPSPATQPLRQPATGDTLHPQKTPKRAKRSAVEEARIRAQREAETFANSRRDPTKREHSLPAKCDEIVPTPVTKRQRPDPEPNSSNEYHPRRGSGDDPHDDSEAEKKERYKRRLDMNRESAAVSRVRRRAYVKELEERLAGVEAEKLQLEGKLEIMMSQNESLKKQLENLFVMVASGRRPVYPPQSQGQPSGQPPGDAA